MSDTQWTPTVLAELKRLWAIGMKTGDIGAALGISKNAVVGKVHRLGLPGRPSPIRKVLTDDSKDEVRRLSASGVLPGVIATQFGVSAEYIRQIGLRHGIEVPRKAPVKRSWGRAERAEVAPVQKPRAPRSADTAPRAIVEPAAASAEPVRLVTPPPRKPNQDGCCWPLWGVERPTHLYCGAVKPDIAQPYCAQHREKAFVQRGFAPIGRRIAA